MAFPTTIPVLTQTESINAILEAEAGIAQCLQLLLSNTLVPAVKEMPPSDKQIALARTILYAYKAKKHCI